MKKLIGIIVVGILLIAGGVYYIKKSAIIDEPPSGNIDISNTTTLPSPVSDLKTYTNTKFGFQFVYPAEMILSESPDKATVTVSSTTTFPSPVGNTIPDYSVSFTATSSSAFGTKQTKAGTVVYDSTKKALVNVSETPPRCLPTENQSSLFINYGGSLMSDPAHFESVLLTNTDLIILTQTLEEHGNTDKIVKGIFSSFKLLNNLQARIPQC